jgi:hypothetical protein
MPAYRYLFPLLFLFLTRIACAQSPDDNNSMRVFVGYARRPVTYTLTPDTGDIIPTQPITLNGLAICRSSGLYLSLQLDSAHRIAPGLARSFLFYIDALGYEATGSQPPSAARPQAAVEGYFSYPYGYVLIEGMGAGYGVQYGTFFMNAGLGVYILDYADNVYAINSHLYPRDQQWYGEGYTMGVRLMAGVTLGNRLSLEVGTTYMKNQTIVPGIVMGLSWRVL